MRPVTRGPAPGPINKYKDAKPHLVRQLGLYCSYCERRIPTNLAVEHIQPKGLAKYAHLENSWENFLLACVNCNSAKGDTDVEPVNYYLPDRDNTYVPFCYLENGFVKPSDTLDMEKKAIAKATIDLVGLNKGFKENSTELFIVAIERFAQRAAAQKQASDSLLGYEQRPIPLVRALLVQLACASGFFSIWMSTFRAHAEVQCAFIDGFPGTGRGCFAPMTAQPISPRNPAPPNLVGGGKI